MNYWRCRQEILEYSESAIFHLHCTAVINAPSKPRTPSDPNPLEILQSGVTGIPSPPATQLSLTKYDPRWKPQFDRGTSRGHSNCAFVLKRLLCHVKALTVLLLACREITQRCIYIWRLRVFNDKRNGVTGSHYVNESRATSFTQPWKSYFPFRRGRFSSPPGGFWSHETSFTRGRFDGDARVELRELTDKSLFVPTRLLIWYITSRTSCRLIIARQTNNDRPRKLFFDLHLMEYS